MMKLVDVKLVIEVAISEHEVLPEVDVLAKKLGVLLSAFILDKRGIEESLRDPNMLRVLGQLSQSSKSLSSKRP